MKALEIKPISFEESKKKEKKTTPRLETSAG